MLLAIGLVYKLKCNLLCYYYVSILMFWMADNLLFPYF